MQIQNPDVGQALRDEAKLTLVESSSQNLLPNVQAVIDVTPTFHRTLSVFSGASSSSGAVTPTAALPGKRLWIYAASLTVAKDATCDVATGSFSINITQNGISKTIAAISMLTLTAQSQSICLTFPQPILCDANTSVTGTNSFTVGAMRRSAIVYAYEEIVS